MKKISLLIENWCHNLSYKKIFISLFLIAISGHIFNLFWKHKNFYVNQYLLLIMLIIQLFVLRKIDLENKILEHDLKERAEMEVWGSFHFKTRGFLSRRCNIILSLFFVYIYIFTMFKVGCIEYTPTGIYGGILGALVFVIGIQAYIKYIGLLYFAYDLKKLHIEHYFFYIPAMTDWIVQLAHEFSYIEKWFLALGLMYSIMYAINVPANAIVFNNGILIQTSCNFLFIITWIGIIIFFALAVPTFTFLSRYFIKTCICKCKSVSIKKIEIQIKALTNNASEKDLSNIQAKLSLIKEISLSEEYPLKYQYTVFHSFYTLSLALLTFISPFISFAKQIIF